MNGDLHLPEPLPDLRDEDIPGSAFAITGYAGDDGLGGDAALARLAGHAAARSGNAVAVEAMMSELERISARCDRARCDMAMPAPPEAFEEQWGTQAPSCWPEVTRRVREGMPGFCFRAEVYGDPGWAMLQQGFDDARDKWLYDHLRKGQAGRVREHFHGGADYRLKLARCPGNRDEPRAPAIFQTARHAAAAGITFSGSGSALVPSRTARGPAPALFAALGTRSR